MTKPTLRPGCSTFGVAKNVYLRGVRVVDCGGYGGTAEVIAAMDWVRLNHIKPAVANMSLGYPYSGAVNTAATSMITIQCISLADQQDRRQYMREQLETCGLPYRFFGFDSAISEVVNYAKKVDAWMRAGGRAEIAAALGLKAEAA